MCPKHHLGITRAASEENKGQFGLRSDAPDQSAGMTNLLAEESAALKTPTNWLNLCPRVGTQVAKKIGYQSKSSRCHELVNFLIRLALDPRQTYPNN
jgi:hypothetical protein